MAATATGPRLLQRPIEICTFFADATLRIFGIPVPLNDPLPRKKSAFLISIGYYSNEHWKLGATHKDVMAMKKLLMGKFGYQEGEIVILSDSDGGITPTKQNIVDYLGKFIVPDGNTDYLFMYCGHSHQRQVPSRVPTDHSDFEEDNYQEFIIPSDALRVAGDPKDPDDIEPVIIHENTISDVDLRKLLVKRMDPTSTLVAFFDTCHSATILNLRHYRCNRVTSWTSSVRRAGRRGVVEPWNKFCRALPQGEPLVVNLDKQHIWTRCNGFCPRISKKDAPKLICVSACKDEQVTIERRDGGVMTRAIIDLLEVNPEPTLQELVRAIKSAADCARRDMKELHKKKKDFCRRKYTLYRVQTFFRPGEVKPEAFHAKWSPQVSSSVPLNMKATLNIGR